MGFGIKVDVKVPAPKVELPKVDVGAAVTGVANAAAGAVASTTAAVTGAVASTTAAVTVAVASATAAVTGAVSSLSSVAGAIADVAVSFTGAIEDLVLEPHLQLDANASYSDTKFEKGPIWIFVDLTPEEAADAADTLHIFSKSGNYDRRYAIRDNYVADSDSDSDATEEDLGYSMVKIRFEDAPMSESFSLEVVPQGAPPYVVFRDISYGDLRVEAMNGVQIDLG
jgi:hypothetical protein